MAVPHRVEWGKEEKFHKPGGNARGTFKEKLS
jgi:hypothetical protein